MKTNKKKNESNETLGRERTDDEVDQIVKRITSSFPCEMNQQNIVIFNGFKTMLVEREFIRKTANSPQQIIDLINIKLKEQNQ